MGYFEIAINPLSEGSSDVLLVTNFHPQWQDGARQLMKEGIVPLLEEYAERVSRWSKIGMELSFSEAYGLSRICFAHRASVELCTQQEAYRSHNLHSVEGVCSAVAVLSRYITYLNVVLPDEGERV